jgi:hypothetical protein
MSADEQPLEPYTTIDIYISRPLIANPPPANQACQLFKIPPLKHMHHWQPTCIERKLGELPAPSVLYQKQSASL